MPDTPLAFLITFTCHGCWLHGDERGSVDRTHNEPGRELLAVDPARRQAELQALDAPPYRLDERRREVVLRSVREVCTHRGWRLLAVHVRTNHVHLLVSADIKPERVMNDVKAYASRALNQTGWDAPACKRWTRHGSTRYLWKTDQVAAAFRYVVVGQGEPMARYPDTDVEFSEGPAS